MSWCDTPVRKLVAIVSLALLAGCFRPMYGEHTGSTPVLQELSGIDVQPIGGRVGQQIRNELLYAFQPNAVAGTPYKLSVTLKQSAEAIILRRSGEAEKSILELRANFALIETATGKVLHGGSVVSRTSYDRSTQLFANQRAELDAENRAAKVVAENLKARISAYFATR